MAIKHKPKFYVRLRTGRPCFFPEDFKIYAGSIYGRFTNDQGIKVFWVCDNYCLIDGKLPMHIFNEEEAAWRLIFVDSSHDCYKWVKMTIKEIGRVPKVDREPMNEYAVKNLMKHDRRHKSGSGSRIYTNQINNPLRWNEVTELAHWEGRGAASVVASRIY